LVRVLVEDVSDVSLAAAYALGEIAAMRAVGPLIAALAHEDPFVRCAAADALGKIHDVRSVAALEATRSDDTLEARGLKPKCLPAAAHAEFCYGKSFHVSS